MKKKNTGVEEIIQGHRAKMNSSDRSGHDQDMEETLICNLIRALGEKDCTALCKEAEFRQVSLWGAWISAGHQSYHRAYFNDKTGGFFVGLRRSSHS